VPFLRGFTGVNGAEHPGILSMRERAALIGADCRCISQPSHGTTIEVRLMK